MAEAVELENMSCVVELEEMARLHLFDSSELKKIAKKRELFECSLRQQTKNKKLCISFIQFEMNLLRKVRQRKQKNGLPQKRMKVEYSIACGLNKLFSEAIRRFPSDVLIWLSYIKFCKFVRFYITARKVFNQMLELHGKNQPVLFKLAANWEMQECKCVDKAKTLLLNGLQIHKDSLLLYTEAFKIELHRANESRNKANAMIDEKNGLCHQASVIYESAAKKVPDVSFVVELLEVSKKYDFTTALQAKILSDLESMFPSDEQTWDTIAKSKLSCVKDKKIPEKERIRQCVAVYKKYVKVLKSERMWSMYIDTLIELRKDKTTYPIFKKNILSSALNSAHNADKLSEKYYFVWVDLLKDAPEKKKKLNQILQQATNRLSNSVSLWETRIRIHLSHGDETLADEAFKEANTALGEQALPVWKLILLHYQAKNSAKAEEIFKEGIEVLQCPNIAKTIKILYLERLAVTRGISAARKAYEQLSSKPPLCLELHSKMAALESFQPEPSVKRARSCHVLACKQFGSNNTDVWMDYIKFETKHGDPSSVSNLYLKATNCLKKKSLVDSFISEYNLAKSNSTI